MNSKFAKISSRENISNSLFAKFSSRENKVLYGRGPNSNDAVRAHQPVRILMAYQVTCYALDEAYRGSYAYGPGHIGVYWGRGSTPRP